MKTQRLIAVIAVLFAVNLARADARIETFTRTTMPGGIGTMEANNKTEYQADKEYTITNFRLTGLAGVGGQYQNSVLVTRVDKGVVWELHHGNKTYVERPLTAPTESAAAGSRGSGTPDKRYRVVKADISVTHPGNKREVNGFACTDHIITFTLVLRDSAEKKDVTEVMTTTLWLTPFTETLRKAQAEQRRYQQAYAAKVKSKLSADEAGRLGLSFMTAMLGLPPEEAAQQLAKVSAELAKLDGYAVITEVKWQLKGDSVPATAAAPEPEPAPSPLSLSRGSLGNYLGNQIARQAIGSQPPSSSTDVLFTSYTEVKTVAVDPVPASDFELPAGYKQVAK